MIRPLVKIRVHAKNNIFFIFHAKTYVVDAQQNRRNETVL